MDRIPIALASWFLDAGGSETQLRQTAVALDRNRFDVHVIHFRPDAARQKQLAAAGLRTWYFPLEKFASPGGLRGAIAVRRYLKENRIQLLHAFDNPSSFFVTPIAWAAKVPVIFASQRGHPHLFPPAHQKLQRLAERLTDATIVNAEALAQLLTAEHHIPPERIRFCPNGLDTRRYQFTDREYPRELDGATVVVGCIARQRPEKHLPFLVDAFAQMKRPGMKLLLVGSGPEEAAISARVEAHNLAGDTLLVPQTSDVPRWMRAIDIFVLCSESEGISNSLLEAMASGAAVVGSRVPGTRELIRDGVNGFLFDFGDAADLSAKVLRLVDDPALRHSIARSSSNWVRETMSVEASASRMGAIYNEFLALKLR